MFKYINNMLPHVFADYFTHFKQIHNYKTRQCQTRELFLPTFFSNFGKKMHSFADIKIWAKIPKEIKENLYYSFKYKYKLFLISNYASDTQK